MDFFKFNSIEHINFEFYRGVFLYFKSILKLVKCIHSYKLDVLHCQMARPVLACVIARLLSSILYKRKFAIIWHSRGLPARSYPLVVSLFAKFNVFIIANCIHERDKILKYGFQKDKITFTYNPLPDLKEDRFKFVSKVKGTKRIRIASLSRLTKDRNVKDAVEIVYHIIQYGFNVELIIGGIGPEEENLRALVNKLGINTNVVFVGKVVDIEDFFNKVDIFINTPALDGDNGAGVGNNILEAALFFKPVVCYDACGTKEIIIHGKTGFCVPIFGIDEFVNSVIQLILNPDLMKKMAENLNTHVKELCSDEKLYDELIQSYYKSLNYV